jgi:hypothetical protein
LGVIVLLALIVRRPLWLFLVPLLSLALSVALASIFRVLVGCRRGGAAELFSLCGRGELRRWFRRFSEVLVVGAGAVVQG